MGSAAARLPGVRHIAEYGAASHDDGQPTDQQELFLDQKHYSALQQTPKVLIEGLLGCRCACYA